MGIQPRSREDHHLCQEGRRGRLARGASSLPLLSYICMNVYTYMYMYIYISITVYIYMEGGRNLCDVEDLPDLRERRRHESVNEGPEFSRTLLLLLH